VTVRSDVYALSLRQPCAWLVVHGGKNIENRRWLRREFPRGPILLHAAQGMTGAEYTAAVRFAQRVAPGIIVPPARDLPRGGFVGRCRITGVLSFDERMYFDLPRPWAMDGQYSYSLVDVAPVPFVPARGELSFYRVPTHDLQALYAAGLPRHALLPATCFPPSEDTT